MEQLTSQQLEDFERAISLAWDANRAYDEMTASARDMSGLQHPIDEVKTVEHFDDASTKFDRLIRATCLLMPPRSAFETLEPAEPFASETVWALMSKEQKVKANTLRTAMAEQFAEYGVTTDSLRVVMQPPEGENKFILLHTGNGIDIGDHSKYYDEDRSYESVMSRKNNDLFVITVGGEKYDTRKSMTSWAYIALCEDAKTQGRTLPDSKQMSEENDDLFTVTMLTGEPLTTGSAVRTRHVVDGCVVRSFSGSDNTDRMLRVRLAVEIE